MEYDETPVRLNPADMRSWDSEAACGMYGDDPNLSWCPERAQSRPVEKEICWTKCPVRRECLTWAIIMMEKFCIYGGYNYGERRRIWRQWKDAGILPSKAIYPRISVDPEEVWRLITEASTSAYGASPNPIPYADLMDDIDEPDAKDLAAIEAEDEEI